MTTYAVVETGGKQYRVAPGDVIDVERLTDSEPGDTIKLEKVLMVSQDGEVTIGTPLVAGAQVVAKIETEGKAKKILVFKYKPKIRYRRKRGHRQQFSRLAIEGIELGSPPAPRPSRARRQVKKDDGS